MQILTCKLQNVPIHLFSSQFKLGRNLGKHLVLSLINPQAGMKSNHSLFVHHFYPDKAFPRVKNPFPDVLGAEKEYLIVSLINLQSVLKAPSSPSLFIFQIHLKVNILIHYLFAQNSILPDFSSPHWLKVPSKQCFDLSSGVYHNDYIPWDSWQIFNLMWCLELG